MVGFAYSSYNKLLLSSGAHEGMERLTMWILYRLYSCTNHAIYYTVCISVAGYFRMMVYTFRIEEHHTKIKTAKLFYPKSCTNI